MRLLTIKKDYAEVGLFVMFIKADPKAIEFIKPIIDGIYPVKDIEALLEKIPT